MATGRLLSYLNPRLLRAVFLQLQQQQEEGLFCDVTLQGDGDGLHVHSCIIAACSPYLAKLLQCSPEISDAGGPVLHNRRILNVGGIPNRYLHPLVRYMYTSALEVSPADAYGVLKTAQKLRIPVLEDLKLEGGRIVRPETGRKLNRGCLGSSTQTYVVSDLQCSGIAWINDDHAHEGNKPFVLGSVNSGSNIADTLENISSSQSLTQTIPSKHLLENVREDGPHIKVRLKRLHNSSNHLPVQNNLIVESKQNKSSPEIIIDPVKKVGKIKQKRPDTPGSEGQKKKKLNGEEKPVISSDGVLSISESGKQKDNIIDMLKPEKMGKHTCANLTSISMIKDSLNDPELSNIRCDEDTDVQINDSKSAEHLTSGQNTILKGEETGVSEGSLACIGMDNKKDADEAEYFDTADPTVNYSCTWSGLEGLSKAESDLKKIQKDTVADCSNSEASITCHHGSTADESGKMQACSDVHLVHEVEKVKLRKIKDGSSWEIVKDMYPGIERVSENAEHMHHLKELLEHMLNMPSPGSDVDVGGCSPVVWTGEGIWPDLSSESDEEINVLY